MHSATPTLILDYLPLAEGARLIRVYGELPCIVLPELLPAADGRGWLALRELGDYCFSEKPRRLPAWNTLCRCVVEEGGAIRLLWAEGRVIDQSGGRKRYSFDEEDAPSVSKPVEEEALHPICGLFLEEITLPDSLRVIGSYAFYNCRHLRRVSAGASVLTMGSDVFLNAFALREFLVRATPEGATSLFGLVNSVTSHVQGTFQPEESDTPLARLWFPEYWEDIEETPAHILLHTFSGQGYHYRQCFLNHVALFAEYDGVFPQGHDADDVSVMARLCFDRLRFPFRLGDAARLEYREFLATHSEPLLRVLLKEQDIEGLKALIGLAVLDSATLAQSAQLAGKTGNAEATALLTDAEHCLRIRTEPVARKKRYDFDF